MNKSNIKMLILVLCLSVITAACSSGQSQEPFVISAIPDQDADILDKRYGDLATYLSEELGVPVEYKASATYDSAVSAFRLGELDMVWYGGLTGVQARLQVDGAQAVIQRDIDELFQSVFIANVGTELEPFAKVEDLTQLTDYSFTYGSQSSTSGRLMPQFFLTEAGVTNRDFNGPVFFSGSHDSTIDLVETGEYETGALSLPVWQARVASGDVDLDNVVVLWETSVYYDYHWVAQPVLTERYGSDFVERLQTAFTSLDRSVPKNASILDGFGAERFIVTENGNYAAIEAIGREIGEIRD